MEHLSFDIVCNFAVELSSISPSAAWVALDILSMYCYGNQERWEQCRKTFREIVVGIPLCGGPKQTQLDMYDWYEVSKNF